MKINFEIRVKKKFVYPVLFAFICLGGYIYFTPYLSIYGFKSAIESKDTEEARKYIDFPSVRRSMKDQLTETLTKRVSMELSNEPFGALKVVVIHQLVSRLVNSTVNSTVNPKGLRLLINQGQFSSPNRQVNEEGVQDNSYSDKAAKVSLYYKTLNRFVLRSDIPNVAEPMKAYWKREGIRDWRLTSIELPFELMSDLR